MKFYFFKKVKMFNLIYGIKEVTIYRLTNILFYLCEETEELMRKMMKSVCKTSADFWILFDDPEKDFINLSNERKEKLYSSFYEAYEFIKEIDTLQYGIEIFEDTKKMDISLDDMINMNFFNKLFIVGTLIVSFKNETSFDLPLDVYKIDNIVDNACFHLVKY